MTDQFWELSSLLFILHCLYCTVCDDMQLRNSMWTLVGAHSFALVTVIQTWQSCVFVVWWSQVRSQTVSVLCKHSTAALLGDVVTLNYSRSEADPVSTSHPELRSGEQSIYWQSASVTMETYTRKLTCYIKRSTLSWNGCIYIQSTLQLVCH